MFCIHCGREIDDDERFCPFCGLEIVDVEDEVETEGSDSETTEETEPPETVGDITEINGGEGDASAVDDEVTEEQDPEVSEKKDDTDEVSDAAEDELTEEESAEEEPLIDQEDVEDEYTEPMIDEPDETEEDYVPGVEEVPRPQKKSHKGFIIALVLLLIAGVGFAVAAFVYPGFLVKTAVSIDLGTLASEPKIAGYDGEAVIKGEITVDMDSQAYKDLTASIEDSSDIASIDYFLKTVEYHPDKKKKLSNGDEINIIATYDEAVLEEMNKESHLEISIAGKEKKVKVEGLKEKPKKTMDQIKGSYRSTVEHMDYSQDMLVYPISDSRVLCKIYTDSGQSSYCFFFSGKLAPSGKISFSDGIETYVEYGMDDYGMTGIDTISITRQDLKGVLDASGDTFYLTIDGDGGTWEGGYVSGASVGTQSPLIRTVDVDQGEHLNLRGKDGKVTVKLDRGEKVYDFDDVCGRPSFDVKNKNESYFDVVYSPDKGKWGLACYDYLK